RYHEPAISGRTDASGTPPPLRKTSRACRIGTRVLTWFNYTPPILGLFAIRTRVRYSNEPRRTGYLREGARLCTEEVGHLRILLPHQVRARSRARGPAPLTGRMLAWIPVPVQPLRSSHNIASSSDATP